MSQFLKGFLSAFDLFPSSRGDIRPPIEQDIENLRNDWETIGNDFWVALWSFEDEAHLPRTKVTNKDNQQLELVFGRK